MSSNNAEERLLDLLSKKASEGLSEEEKKQLNLLLNEFEDDSSFELAAAAISMIDLKTNESLPDHLKARILADADEVMDAQRGPAVQAIFPAAAKTALRKPWNINWLGWAAAAVACIALAFSLWMPRPAQIVYVPEPAKQEQMTPAQMRENLMASPDVIKASWAPGNVKELKDVAGDIVWSDSKQAGYMRFRGLPVNDKTKQTYQLWIFDETQDEKTPIDGGTFDIQDNGDIIIPINAKLKAVHPKMFAVTVEKPGGVVVSKREKIPALAKVET
jgi:hypothetical protein